MILRQLRASFGRLSGDTLTLGEGLNVITAPNESGKSTWCAFIRAMLYGIPTGDRDKAGYLADKTRYRPWSGAVMEGSMLVTHGGRELLLERTTTGAAPMRTFTARDPATGRIVPELTGETVGETLTGLSQAVFTRTAFIGQAGLQVGQTGELEKRITGLVSTGEENVATATEAAAGLRSRMRKLRYRQTGKLPELEREIDSARTDLTRMETLSQRITQKEADLAALEAETETLTARLRREEELRQLRHLEEARRRLALAENECARLDALLTLGGRRIGRSHISAVRAALGTLAQTRGELTAAQTALEGAETARRAAERAVAADPLGGKTLSQAEACRQEAEELARRQKKGALPLLLLCILACMGGLVPGGLTLWGRGQAPTMPAGNPVPFAGFWPGWVLAGLALALAGGAVLIWLIRRRRRTARQLRSLLLALGTADPTRLEERIGEYRALLSARDTALEKETVARADRDAAQAAQYRAEGSAAAMSRALLPEAEEPREVLAGLEELESLLDRAEAAAAAREAARQLLEREERELSPEIPPAAPGESPGDREEILAALADARERRSDLLRETGTLRGELGTIGDPVVLLGRLDRAREELAEGERELAALQLAAAELELAGSEMQERLSPLLNKRAGELLGRMTGGRYDAVTYDRSLAARITPRGETVSHSALSLSTGASDQVYLALRLAVCTLLDREGEEPCPLILDDALAAFDDRRLENTLSLLAELGKTRQILLFTCQEREAVWARTRPEVTCLRV